MRKDFYPVLGIIAFSRQKSRTYVMAGLVPAIHDLFGKKDVDGRDKHGHDAVGIALRCLRDRVSRSLHLIPLELPHD